MPIDPHEDPPIKPGQPAEPPQEDPLGNPRPEVPPPMQEPGEPPRPEELPGRTPEELPVRGPEGPRTPSAATDTESPICQVEGPDLNLERIRDAAGDNVKYGLKRSPECAMNKDSSELCAFGNKYKSAFEGRHNPA